MNFPNGSQAVIDARKKGFKPAEMLIVSLIGPTGESNHTIHAKATTTYDWRWVVGLEVCIYIDSRVNWKPLARNIAAAKPKWLGIYDAERFQGADVWYLPSADDIAKPSSHWRYRMTFLPWLDFQNNAFAWGN